MATTKIKGRRGGQKDCFPSPSTPLPSFHLSFSHSHPNSETDKWHDGWRNRCNTRRQTLSPHSQGLSARDQSSQERLHLWIKADQFFFSPSDRKGQLSAASAYTCRIWVEWIELGGSRPAARGRFGTGLRPRVVMEAKGEEDGTSGRGEKRICPSARVFPVCQRRRSL